MPRYFFHIVDEAGIIKDDEGAVFDGIEVARSEAQESARELGLQFMRERRPLSGQRIEIMDENGAVCGTEFFALAASGGDIAGPTN
jgi:hypothetical protein